MSKKAFRVVVVFEFGGIDDPNSDEASEAVDEVTREVRRLVQGDWESPCESVTTWVDDAYIQEEI